MPDYIRPELIAVYQDIQDVRNALRGGNYIRSLKEEYLPRVSDQDQTKYTEYLNRAFFVGAVSATVKGFTSSVFRKSINVSGDAGLIESLTDIDGKGSNIQAYCNNVFKEVITSGRASQWIAPTDNEYYLLPYKSEQHINWIPQQFTVFHEKARKGDIEIEYVDQLRVIKRIEGKVRMASQPLVGPIELDSNPSLTLTDKVPDSRDVPFVGQFPVIPVTPDGIGYDPMTIPLSALAEANYDHYRLSAYLRSGLHTAPYPVFYAAGFGEDKELRIGDGKAWVARGAATNATAGVLEYHGYALQWLLQTLQDTVGFMIAFGARMLEHDKRSTETAEALKIRQASQEANIIGLVRSCSAGITLGLRTLLAYRNNTTIDHIDISVDLPTDLIETRLTSDELLALVTGWVKGAITDEMLEFNFRQGEVLQPNITSVEAIAAIQKSRAVALANEARAMAVGRTGGGEVAAGRGAEPDS